MNYDEDLLIEYWIEKSYNSLKAAKINLENELLNEAVNRLYYSVFYMVYNYMQIKGKTYKKHSAVRSFFNKELVKTGIIDKDLGSLYNLLYELRETADYRPFVEFEYEEVESLAKSVEEFLERFEKLIKEEKPKNQ